LLLRDFEIERRDLFISTRVTPTPILFVHDDTVNRERERVRERERKRKKGEEEGGRADMRFQHSLRLLEGAFSLSHFISAPP
jgi:hypothetical protein